MSKRCCWAWSGAEREALVGAAGRVGLIVGDDAACGDAAARVVDPVWPLGRGNAEVAGRLVPRGGSPPTIDSSAGDDQDESGSEEPANIATVHGLAFFLLTGETPAWLSKIIIISNSQAGAFDLVKQRSFEMGFWPVRTDRIPRSQSAL